MTGGSVLCVLVGVDDESLEELAFAPVAELALDEGLDCPFEEDA